MILEDGVTVVWSKDEDRAILYPFFIIVFYLKYYPFLYIFFYIGRYAAKSKAPSESFMDCWMRQSADGLVTKTPEQIEKRYNKLMELMQLFNSKSTRTPSANWLHANMYTDVFYSTCKLSKHKVSASKTA